MAFGGTPNSRRKDTVAEERKEGAGQTWRHSILWSVGATGEPERRQQENQKRPRAELRWRNMIEEPHGHFTILLLLKIERIVNV